MKIAYNLLIVLDVDPETDEAYAEVKEVSAQCRLAAQHAMSMGVPDPGESVRLSAAPPPPGSEPVGRSTVVYLSAVEL